MFVGVRTEDRTEGTAGVNHGERYVHSGIMRKKGSRQYAFWIALRQPVPFKGS